MDIGMEKVYIKNWRAGSAGIRGIRECHKRTAKVYIKKLGASAVLAGQDRLLFQLIPLYLRSRKLAICTLVKQCIEELLDPGLSKAQNLPARPTRVAHASAPSSTHNTAASNQLHRCILGKIKDLYILWNSLLDP